MAISKARNAAIDRARSFLTLVVVLHHAVIPYTYYGHTDAKSWFGFDMVVLATDSFFMAMFFFLSGLFVWPGLSRKSPGNYLRDRLLRLGLPFAISALTLIPLAYYSIALRTEPDLSFSSFWWRTVNTGPWPSGPIWFLWVLLAFDLGASLLHRLQAAFIEKINRLSEQSFDRPTNFFLFLLAVTLVAYIPALLYFGPTKWFEFGPFDIQASRMLLYPSYFLIGVGVGASGIHRGVLSENGRLAKGKWNWFTATLVAYSLLWMMIYIKRGILGNPSPQPDWYIAIYGIFYVTFSASILFAILGFFLSAKRPWKLLDRLQGDAYGIFLVHYPIVLWLQYWMSDFDLTAILKATMAFLATVALSWVVTAVLRKIPGAKKVL